MRIDAKARMALVITFVTGIAVGVFGAAEFFRPRGPRGGIFALIEHGCTGIRHPGGRLALLVSREGFQDSRRVHCGNQPTEQTKPKA